MERGAGQITLSPASCALSGLKCRLRFAGTVLANPGLSSPVLAGSRFVMKQKSRTATPQKPTLAHIISDLVRLLKAIEDLESLREKVRRAEAARVLH
jgi:hypothetical protein